MAQQKENTFDVGNSKGFVEWIFKGLILLVVYMGQGIQADVEIMKTTLTTAAAEKLYFEKRLVQIDKFIEKPRFTKEDFEIGVNPIIKQLNINTDELNKRTVTFSEVQEKLIRYDLRIKQLEK